MLVFLGFVFFAVLSALAFSLFERDDPGPCVFFVLVAIIVALLTGTEVYDNGKGHIAPPNKLEQWGIYTVVACGENVQTPDSTDAVAIVYSQETRDLVAVYLSACPRSPTFQVNGVGGLTPVTIGSPDSAGASANRPARRL